MTEAVDYKFSRDFFDPAHETGFGIKVVRFHGEIRTVHNTANLAAHIIAYGIHAAGGELHRTDSAYIETLRQKETELQFFGLFERYRALNPQLWDDVVKTEVEGAILRRAVNNHGLLFPDANRLTPVYEEWVAAYEDTGIRAVACSVIFDGLVDLLPPGTNPGFLCT